MQYFDILAIIAVCIIIVAVSSYVRKKRAVQLKKREDFSSPSIGNADNSNNYGDDGIIAVRKHNSINDENPVCTVVTATKEQMSLENELDEEIEEEMSPSQQTTYRSLRILYVMAKKGTFFSGYELLQILLSAGFRFGDKNIFHQYSEPNDQKGVLFSLASATEPGTFDIQNMGAVSCVGLTLFMQGSRSEDDDDARYDFMLQTARHLAEDLHAILLDSKKNLISEYTDVSRVDAETELKEEQRV